MRKLWRIVALCVGVTLFGWYVYRVGPRSVWETVRPLGALAPLILAPFFVVYLVDCLAWTQTLPRRGISFWTLLRIRWAGESVNSLIPTAYVGGEAVKVLLLRQHGISAGDGATAAVISKTAQTVAQLGFVLAATAVLVSLEHGGLPARQGALGIVVCGTVMVAALFGVQKLGIFRLGVGLLDRLGRRAHWVALERNRLLQLDSTLVGFYRTEPGRFLRATLLYLGGWMLDTVEIYLVATLLGVAITWPQAFVAEAFTGVAKALGMWIPGSLGVQESGIVLVGRVVGLPESFTAAYALIRRARELLFAAVGLGLLSRERAGGATRGWNTVTILNK